MISADQVRICDGGNSVKRGVFSFGQSEVVRILCNHVPGRIIYSVNNDTVSIFDGGIIPELCFDILNIDGVLLNNDIDLLPFVVPAVSYPIKIIVKAVKAVSGMLICD